jgi:hypothetical protein
MPSFQTTSPTSLQAFWSNPSSFGMTLLTIFLDTFGMEAAQWDPLTIQMEVEQEFNVELPPSNYDKLLTAISILTTNSFYVSVPDFSRACVVLSGHHPTPNLLILPDCADIAWGITEGVLIMPPPEDHQNPFSPEITTFIGYCLDSEGIINPPDVLRIATRDRQLVDRVNYEYSDDPEMLSSIYKMEESKTDDINKMVKSRIRSLLMQLASLPLRVGKTEVIVKKMLANLPENEEPLPLPQ